MEILPKNVTKLIEEFSKLPSVGNKTAERLTFYLLKYGDTDGLGGAVTELKQGLMRCEQCRTITDQQRCVLCSNPRRDQQVIAVVSQPLDIVAIEKTGLFHGTYHVLHGVISPVDGLGPENLEIESLLARVATQKPTEVILATNPNLEGETTALYIGNKLQPLGVKVTRLAHGLPIGGDLEYADQLTLGRALDNRRSF